MKSKIIVFVIDILPLILMYLLYALMGFERAVLIGMSAIIYELYLGKYK